MPQLQTSSIPREKFLRLCTNLLYTVFLQAARTEAKRLYRQLDAGTKVALTRMQMEDKSELRFDLSMDKSQHRGKLNFTSFRNGLALLVNNLNEQLLGAEDIQVFSAQDNPEQMIFGVLGVTQEAGQANVLALGADTGTAGEASVELQLLYLDPAQFARQPD
jgi:hypothetical protein